MLNFINRSQHATFQAKEAIKEAKRSAAELEARCEGHVSQNANYSQMDIGFEG